MVQCKDIAEEASNYIEGDLPFRQRIGLFIHLIICKCCRNYLRQIRNTITTISIIRPEEKNVQNTHELAKHVHEACTRPKLPEDAGSLGLHHS